MIKILVINTVPMEINGITNVIMSYYDNLDTDKYHMDFVAINDCDKSIREKIENRDSKLFVIKGRLKNPLIYMYRLSEIAKGYNVIHAHGNSATLLLEMMAAKNAGVAVRIAHSHTSTCKYVLVDKICRPFFYKDCNGYLACGNKAGRWLFGKKKFTVIHNGIDTEKYAFSIDSRIEVRQELGWSDNIVLGHIGAFNEFKNQSFIIDAFKKIYKKNTKYRLLLIGDGSMKEEMIRKVESLNLKKEICFWGSSNSVERLLNAIDLILMPSFNEGFPLTLLEEQANGLDCIVSDRIGKEVNLSGNVEFYPIDCGPELWADVIIAHKIGSERKLKSEDAIKKIVNAGYDIKGSVRMLENYYKKRLRYE